MRYKFTIEKKHGMNPKVNINGNLLELTIFGDLIEHAVPNREAEAIMDFGTLIDRINPNEDVDYFPTICDLRAKIEQEAISSLDELERLRSFCKLTFRHTFVAKNKIGSICPIQLGFSKIEPLFLQDTEIEHYCIYECFSMRDGVFSLLHYLFLNGYKLKKCEHCGKYFPTKTLKRKYCSRNSPYRKHEDTSCGEAVDHIIKTIKKRRKNILKYMRKYFPKAIPEFTNELDAALKTPKNVAQLDELEHLTSREYVKEHWYKEKYK